MPMRSGAWGGRHGGHTGGHHGELHGGHDGGLHGGLHGWHHGELHGGHHGGLHVGHNARQHDGHNTAYMVPGGVIWWDSQGNQRYTHYFPTNPLTLPFFLMMMSIPLIAAPAVVLGIGFEDAAVIIGMGSLLSVALCLLLFTCNLCRIRQKRVIPMVFPGATYMHRNEPLTELPPGAMVKYWVG